MSCKFTADIFLLSYFVSPRTPIFSYHDHIIYAVTFSDCFHPGQAPRYFLNEAAFHVAEGVYMVPRVDTLAPYHLIYMK